MLMPQGYHPNVAAPGGAINFLWMMAANREDDDRQFGVVNVQPEFAAQRVGPRQGTEHAMNDPEPGRRRSSTPTGRRFRSSASPTASSAR